VAAGGVDQQVDRPKLCRGAGGRRFDLDLPRNVRRQRQATTAVRCDRPRRLLHFRHAAGQHGDGSTRRGKCLRDRPADAAAPARHQRDTAAQFPVVNHRLSRSSQRLQTAVATSAPAPAYRSGGVEGAAAVRIRRSTDCSSET